MVVHGDLYARHLLKGDEGALCGVIDWGDLHLGDPALDLNVAYALLPPEDRAAFWSAYGDVDDATRARARFRALHYGVTLVWYGLDIGDEALIDVGALALSRALTGGA